MLLTLACPLCASPKSAALPPDGQQSARTLERHIHAQNYHLRPQNQSLSASVLMMVGIHLIGALPPLSVSKCGSFLKAVISSTGIFVAIANNK